MKAILAVFICMMFFFKFDTFASSLGLKQLGVKGASDITTSPSGGSNRIGTNGNSR